MEKYIVFGKDYKKEKLEIKKGKVCKLLKIPGKTATQVVILYNGKSIKVPMEFVIADVKNDEWQTILKQRHILDMTGKLNEMEREAKKLKILQQNKNEAIVNLTGKWDKGMR